MAGEIDVKAITDRLKMAKQIEKDCVQQLIGGEPVKEGIYRDAQGDLWIHACGYWRMLRIEHHGKDIELDYYRKWDSVIDTYAMKGTLPLFRFITPIEEEEKEEEDED